MTRMDKRGRILSGMRPTGRLHLGNYLGALVNWVALQDDYECFYSVVDWHALTTGHDKTEGLTESIHEMVLDWLAAGLDPERSVLFVQSHVPQHAILHLLFSMVTPMSWLERNPTVKEMVRDLGLKENLSYGLIGYPVLQAADILVYKATTVPVGEDQLAHLELSREIARRFNHLYREVFPEPQAKLTETPLVLGTDGRKMSKSLNNTIGLSEDAETVTKKVRMMVTDPQKIRNGDPGRPEICPVFGLHKLVRKAQGADVEAGCRSGALGCVDCKTLLAGNLNASLEPLRERRRAYEKDASAVRDVLAEGDRRAAAAAEATLQDVRAAMNMSY